MMAKAEKKNINSTGSLLFILIFKFSSCDANKAVNGKVCFMLLLLFLLPVHTTKHSEMHKPNYQKNIKQVQPKNITVPHENTAS